MRIIDAHMHLGEDLMFNTDDSEAVLLGLQKDYGVSAQIVQPGIVSRDQKKAHERIKAFIDANPGRAYGLSCFSPYLEEKAYVDLVRWAVKDLGFKGVKIHPNAFCMNPTHPATDKIYGVAEELGIPVMIHTGNGLPNALPGLAVPAAKAHPRLTIILAHAGGGTFGADAVVAAQTCPNIVLETSWTTVYDLAAMVKKIGPERVMFGTDIPDNVPVELAKYRVLKLKDSDLEWCLGKTAERVFAL